MVKTTDISVVMPIWIKESDDSESINMTEQALESLGDNIQWVIVDNGSATGSGWLKSKADVYLRFPDNRGYTVGINRGISLADGELIVLANNDIRVSPGWQNIARETLVDTSVATLHSKMIGYDEPFGLGSDVFKTGHERWCHNSFTITTRRFLNEMKEKEISKEPFPGLFDENYGKGGGADDWDFFYRVRSLGYKTCYTNKIAFQHKDGFTYKTLGAEREKVVQENNDYFFKKWGMTKEESFAKDFPEQVFKDYNQGFV